MKKSIKMMLAGLLFVPVLVLGVATAQPASAQSSIKNGAGSAQGNGQPANLFDGDDSIFKKVTNAALFIIGAVSVLMLIYGGIRYTISGGDSNAVTAAKNTILYAIVGIVVAVMAYALVNFVLNSLIP